MTFYVRKNQNGEIQYHGFQTEKQQQQADEFLKMIEKQFPEKTKEYAEAYSDGSSMYYYKMGSWLRKLVNEFGILNRDYSYLFNEIIEFAPDKERLRKTNDNRNPYFQAFNFSELKEAAVNKLTWHDWQSLLERPDVIGEKRIFKWIEEYDIKEAKGKNWRSLLKMMHAYLLKIDTSLFSDQEMFNTFNSFVDCIQVWNKEFKIFKRSNLKSAKVKDKKSESKWQQKYFLKYLQIYETGATISKEESAKIAQTILHSKAS
ncbi:MAG: hypothetical protein LKF81_11230 [Prevotella sp.]|jgi:hypothetical protein|nr:hypothetical protein [Prevotella sp.]